MPDVRKLYVINGKNFNNIDTFYNELQQVFTRGLDWKIGRNLDSLRDVLRGGFGRHEYGEPIRVKWLYHEKSVRDLGTEKMNSILSVMQDTNCLVELQ